MAFKKLENIKRASKAAPPPRRQFLPWILGAFAALFVVFEVYGPVMNGPFIFDDDYLPFRVPGFSAALGTWLFGVRPLLMLTYWVNYRISPSDTFFYHLFNLVFHFGAGTIMFLVLRRLLALANVDPDRRLLLCLFGAGLFLLHPVQTESVAYVASRSENLSVFFFLAAYAIFLGRLPEAVSWPRAAAVVGLFGAAITSKEHTLVLPGLLLLTDYYWNPGFSFAGIRRNWRLYGPVAAGFAGGLLFIGRMLFGAATAGFGLKDFRWYEYFFTQCRALFVYLRLFVLPFGLTVDYDYPLSRSLFDHGAVLGLLALVAITVAAWIWRRRFPLMSFGWFVFLILMAPTSSVMPIKDVIAERRLYLSMLGLLLIAIELVRRIPGRRVVLGISLAGVLAVAAVLAQSRNQVWNDRIALWEDTVRKSPGKARPHFQLGYAYFEAGRCGEAVRQYQEVARIQGPAYDLLVDWGLAYDCLNQTDQALGKLGQAATIEKSAHVYALMGMVYAKGARWREALEALAKAESINPAYAPTFVYRGDIHRAQNAFAAAAEEYRRALALDPGNELARTGLGLAEQRLRTF